MSTQPKNFLTPQEYLAIERKAQYKSEYWNGKMYAMAGASGEHTDIQCNIVFRLRLQLQGGSCRIRSSDMRVQTRSNLYTYPDVVVVCGKPEYADKAVDTLLNPLVIIEILAPSTESYDRGMKFEQYRGIETLRAYLMVSSDRMHVELFSKRDDGQWSFDEWNVSEEIVKIEACKCGLKIGEIYENVEFGR